MFRNPHRDSVDAVRIEDGAETIPLTHLTVPEREACEHLRSCETLVAQRLATRGRGVLTFGEKQDLPRELGVESWSIGFLHLIETLPLDNSRVLVRMATDRAAILRLNLAGSLRETNP